MTRGTKIYDSIDMEVSQRKGWWLGFVVGIATIVGILVACFTAGLYFDV